MRVLVIEDDKAIAEHVAKGLREAGMVVDVCIENKLREALKAGAARPITTKDLLAAVERLKPTTKEWFSTAKNYALYSNQGGAYDDILAYLKMK